MTKVLKRCPRYFDPVLVDQTSLGNIPTLLSARHAHLSATQHQDRLVVAAHEASHLLMALLTKTTNFGTSAYIRVPGKSSKYGGKAGANGSVPIGNLSNHKADMMVSLAGSMFSGMVEPENEIISLSDQKGFEKRLAEYAREKGISLELAEETFGQMVIDTTATVLVKYWATIDWLATALLLHCTASGDINLGPIIEYFYADCGRLKVPARSTYFTIPQKHADYVKAYGSKFSIPNEQ